MLSNSVIAGGLASVYLTILVLHLNPSFPLSFRAVLPLALAMAIVYGIILAAAFFALIVLQQILANEELSPGWLSVRVLSWLCTIAAGVCATLMWLNLRAFSAVLDAQTVTRMTAGAITLSASAVVFLLIALAHLGRRGGRVSAVLLTAMMAISVAASVTARGRARENPPTSWPSTSLIGLEPLRTGGKVVVIALDGATLDVISPAIAEGRLPNFGRIFDAGAVLHLATLRPTQAEPVWSAVATGRVPVANGVRAAARFRVAWFRSAEVPEVRRSPGTLEPNLGSPAIELLPDYCFAQALVRSGLLGEQPHDSSSLKARPLWSILSDAGLVVGIIGWPLTHPAPQVNGFLVSDQFHRLAAIDTGAALSADQHHDLDLGASVAPTELLVDVRQALQAPLANDPVSLVAKIAETRPSAAEARADRTPVAADRMHLQLLTALSAKTAPQFMAVRLPGLDAVAHYFLRYAEPSAFGDVTPEERRRYGRVLSEYYAFIDSVVGRAIESMGPEDLTLVISGFGMEPLEPGKRMLERLAGDAMLSGSHERSPDGFLVAYGPAVAPGRPRRASVLDLAPTVLYYLGLPIGRDMEGFARTDLFRESFTASRPITFIPSYGR